MALFGIKNGLKIFGSENTSDILNGTSDPSAAAGVAAPLGSLYLRSDGVSYKKTGAADTDWQAYSEIEGGGLLWSTISGATTVESSKGYILDSSSAAFTVTMPASPEEGDSVGFAGLSDIETNNITVDLNSLNMNGSSDDLIIDLNYCYFEMLYTGDASVGWVLSNTDESGNVDNIQSFIGNGDNVDSAVTEYTEENYIVDGDDLETSIDKLDMALFDVDTSSSGLGVDLTTLSGRVTVNEGDIATNETNITTNYNATVTNATNITTNASGITALESYTGSAGDSSPDYNQENYITDGDSLEEAISKLDAALQVVDNLSATGVNWQQSIEAVTGDVVNTGAGFYTGTDHFSDDDAPYWVADDWADGDQVLSTNTTTSGLIYTWNDGASQWVQSSSLGANDAVAVQYDFLDDPGSQEDGAAYMMNSTETEVIKIADFDLETAASIALSSAYTASSGTISSTDSVESAIEKLDYNLASAAGDLTTLEGRVTTNETNITTNYNATVTNASGIATNVSDIGDLEAAVGSSTGLAGMDYTSSNYVTIDSTAIAAISALDSNLGILDTATTSGIARIDTNIDNLDTAHDNLAAAVLTEVTTSVNASSTDTVVDTVTQAGNLGAKWFVVVYDGSGNRYAAEIYAMHDGVNTADLTEYAILTIGTAPDVEFDIAANSTSMTLTVDNAETSGVTVKTQRISVQTSSVNTTAVITS